jgi:hypothetical protein
LTLPTRDGYEQRSRLARCRNTVLNGRVGQAEVGAETQEIVRGLAMIPAETPPPVTVLPTTVIDDR